MACMNCGPISWNRDTARFVTCFGSHLERIELGLRETTKCATKRGNDWPNNRATEEPTNHPTKWPTNHPID
jgi:hypothetical protein